MKTSSSVGSPYSTEERLPQANLQEFLRAKSILWLLVRREFRSRYAGSNLGVFWNIIHPIVLVGIYVLIFSTIMAGQTGGGSTLDYAVHLTSGIIPWLVFSEILSRCTTSLVDNASFLQKIALPVEVLHLSVFLNTLIIHTFSFVALAGFLLVVGYDLPIRFLWVFPLTLLLALVALGLGLLLSVLHLVLRDVGQLVGIGLQFMFWLTPIIYPFSLMPEFVQTILRYNPLLPYISLSQYCFGAQNAATEFLISAQLIFILPFLTISAGILFLRKHRTDLLDLL
ncbi:MAG: ABC transporter permease [Sumerlaeia bacterium]